MVRWLRWHCPPDTGFEIRALAVWGRARYLSVTEAPRNTDFHTWMGKKHFCFFQTAESGNRTPNSGVKGSGANHYPRAPAQLLQIWRDKLSVINIQQNSFIFPQKYKLLFDYNSHKATSIHTFYIISVYALISWELDGVKVYHPFYLLYFWIIWIRLSGFGEFNKKRKVFLIWAH